MNAFHSEGYQLQTFIAVDIIDELQCLFRIFAFAAQKDRWRTRPASGFLGCHLFTVCIQERTDRNIFHFRIGLVQSLPHEIPQIGVMGVQHRYPAGGNFLLGYRIRLSVGFRIKQSF